MKQLKFVGADGSVLKNTKLSLNIVKEGQAYDTAAQQMKAAIENEMSETLKNSSISYLEMNLTDEAGQTVTFKNARWGLLWNIRQEQERAVTHLQCFI